MVEVERDGGIVILHGDKRILLDPLGMPRKKPSLVFVSHAHSDHYRLRVLDALASVPKLMSPATRELIDPRARLRNVVEVAAGEEVEVAGELIAVYDAGHVLGSLQLRMNLGGEEVVYTGDLNTEKRVILRPAAQLRCDTLIIEATYGHPAYSFPPRATLYRDLLSELKRKTEAGRPPTIGARTLGTAQEVTALISLSGFSTPVVYESIARRNAVYERHGEVLGGYMVTSSVDRHGNFPLILPLGMAGRDSIQCTGWAIDGGVPLSSHCDFKGLLRYVKSSGASRVYATCGFKDEFAKYLRLEHIEASAI